MKRFLATLLGVVLLVRPAAAEPRPVVLVSLSKDESAVGALAARVEAELRAVGFEPVVAVASGDEPTSLEAAARDAHAIAAVHIVQKPSARSEIWVADRVTGKTVLRTVTVGPGEDPVDVLAVRSVELLRASLLEIEASHPSRGEVRPTSAVREAVAAARPPTPKEPTSLSLAAGFGVQLAPGISPSFQALVSLAWTPSRLGLELIGAFPIAPGQVCAADGCARVSSGLLGGGLRFLFTRLGARIQPELGVGFAAALVQAEGTATPPFTGRVTDGAVATAYARALLAVGLTSYLRLGAEALVGVGMPPISIRFAGSQVAQWGAPFATILLRTEVAFP